jgi:hypothetical protein
MVHSVEELTYKHLGIIYLTCNKDEQLITNRNLTNMFHEAYMKKMSYPILKLSYIDESNHRSGSCVSIPYIFAAGPCCITH